MTTVDLNLLHALDVLLDECSVTGAARRLGLSPSAMSRTLSRLRAVTGDPLLVQAGRIMVLTPHARQLADRAHAIAEDARGVLLPASAQIDPATLARPFAIRANEGFVTRFAADLITGLAGVAPKVRLRFLAKPDKDPQGLRDGAIDLDIGTAGSSAPEVRSKLMFRDRFIGVVRTGHPLLDHTVTAETYVAHGHVVAARRLDPAGPVDAMLAQRGLVRDIVAVVPGFGDALAVASRTDLIALVPASCLDPATPGLCGFPLPVQTPDLAISAMWHPRHDADPGHRWLRQQVIASCRLPQRPDIATG